MEAELIFSPADALSNMECVKVREWRNTDFDLGGIKLFSSWDLHSEGDLQDASDTCGHQMNTTIVHRT